MFKGCSNFTEIRLPSTLKTIGGAAFEVCTGLTEIELPEGLTSIGGWSFNGCTGLKEIKLPDSVTELGRYAFTNCTNLESINYPMSLSSTGDGIFNGDSKLKSITVPEGIERLSDNAFKNCSNFTEIRLPKSLKEIGGAAFEGCTGLTEIELPEGLTSIGGWSFNDCTGLKEMKLPDTVTAIGRYAFTNCTNLSSINYPMSLNSTGDGIFSGDNKLKSITVPEGIERLPDNVFKNCSNFTEIRLPSTLKTIGNAALENTSFERLVLPDGVTSIEAYAFCNCRNLEQIWIGAGVTSIHDRSFWGCGTDKLVIHGTEGSYAQKWSIEKGYRFATDVIGQDDLILKGKVVSQEGGISGTRVDVYNCDRLKVVYTVYTDENGEWSYNSAETGNRYRIQYYHAKYKFEDNNMELTVNQDSEIPEVSAEAIEWIPEENAESDFQYTEIDKNTVKITGYLGTKDVVVIPEVIDGYEVQVLGSAAFRDRNDIKAVVLPEGITEIQECAFQRCTQLENVRLSTTITTIGGSAFSECHSLTELEFPGGLTSIGGWGSNNCPKLVRVVLPDGLTTISRNTFSGCINLESINYPMSLKNAGERIFEGDNKLKSITVPEGVKELPDNVFKGCSNFTEIRLPSTLKTIGGAAFEVCTGLTEIELPEGLTSIGGWSFNGCTGLKEIKLPDSVTELGRYAFTNCTNLESINYPMSLSSTGDGIFNGDSKLKSITVPEGIERLSDNAFKNCSNFTEIRLPKSLKEIGGAAFEGCTGLTEIELPEGLTSIGGWSFNDCTGLKEMKLPDTVTAIGRYAFTNCTNLSSINYPMSLNSTGDGIFSGDSKLKSITVPEGIEKLPDNVFKNCSKIRYINLPETLTSIGASAFEGCIGMPSIIIPENVTSIGAYAFAACDGLITMTIPGKIKSLSRYSFANCSNLSKMYIPDNIVDIDDNTFDRSSRITFYCSYNSYATVYAINKNIPFVSTGLYTENQESVLDRNNTSYYGDFNGITSNGYIAMTVKYKIKEEQKNSVSGAAIEIVLPSNAEFDESTLKVDGILATNYNYDGGRILRIPLSNTEGTIRYTVKAKEQSDITSCARMYFFKDGEQIKEIIGIVNESISLFTVDAPDITSEENFEVSGVAPASSKIILKVDGKEQKEVKASKAGMWSSKLHLENPVDYQDYKIEAVSNSANQGTETRSAQITYHQGEPSLSSFKMTYYEHDQLKSCDMLNTNGVLPIVYYLPGTKFNFELSFKNADQIKDIYVTSTRNNETKYLKATYNEQKKAFVTDGYFDENDHNYVPGMISYEYSKPVPSVTVGQNVNWEELLKNLPVDMINGLTVTKNTSSDYDTTIDLSSLGEEFSDVILDANISIFDDDNDTKMGEWKDLLEENDNLLSYFLPGYDDEKYICNLDYSDEGTWYMLIKDITGNKYIGLILDTTMENEENLDKYWDLLQISSSLSTINKTATIIYKNYQIEQEMDQLKEEIMTSGSYSSTEELNKALKAVDNLEYNKKMFTLLTFALPLIVAAPVTAVGATMSIAPTVLFTAILGTLTATSAIFWDIQKAKAKGEKYKAKFIIDPSGYIYDSVTGERLEDVTVTAYCIEYDESSDFWSRIPSADEYGKIWDSSEYNQQNPLLTNADGKYAWDVPEGWWRVKAEKKGYDTVWSDWMTVPPLQTEINIGMTPNGKEEIEHQWDAGTVEEKPTCTTTGIIRYECLDCHQTKTEILPIDSSNHVKVVTEPEVETTCTEQGKTEKIYCAGCKTVIKESNSIAATGRHKFTNYISDNNATTKADGTKTAYCDYGCGTKDTIPDPGTKVPESEKPQESETNPNSQDKPQQKPEQTTLKKVAGVKVASKAKGRVNVSWKRVTGAKGYQVQYSQKKNFAGAKTMKVSGGKKVKAIVKKLKSKKTYYFRVRAIAGKTTGKWSAVKKVKKVK